MDIPTSEVRWTPCYRIIPSRFPPISLFEAVADPADLEAVYAIEAMTNDRLRDEAGELSLVPPEDRVSGPGSSPIMAAFTHLNPVGDRFTDEATAGMASDLLDACGTISARLGYTPSATNGAVS